MRKVALSILFVFLPIASLFAQTPNAAIKCTISGYVKDAKSDEELIGATVTIKELPGIGAATNAYGFYSLTIPQSSYTVVAQYIGYEAKEVKIVLVQNTKLDFNLAATANELNTVVITGQNKSENVTQTQMGVDKLDIQQISSVPVLFGEKDVMKTLQLLPGIKSVGEGNSGFYVRGGASDQNLVLLDEAVVYNPSHLLGFFSVFNSDAIKDVTVYKGGEPAEYGGRLSSVLDIKMNDGNDQKFHISGGIGLISSRLCIEGPIVKHKGSFMISARRTYADLFLKLSPDTNINKARLYFYDLNAKANYTFNDNNRVYLSGYFGKDVLGFGTTFGINWGNATGTIRWNHLYSDKLFSNTSLIFSNYDYVINVNFGGNSINIISRIQDYNLKEDFQYYASTTNTIKFGVNSIFHRIIPGVITTGSTTDISGLDLTNKYAWENAAYLGDDFKPTKRFSMNYGLRFSVFSALGPGDFYNYSANGETLDTISYNTLKFVKTYFNLEPRASANYLLNEKSSIKASYGRNTQNLHLLSNSTSGNPTDLWIPSSNNVRPEIADQVSLGYFRNFKDNMYEFSAEVYYKIMQHEIDYRDDAQLTFNENVESQLLYGKGRAYGIELLMKKNAGKLTGWIGYTLSRTELQIDGINSDNWYPARQDEPNDVSVVGIYQLSKKITLSATFVYNSGNAVTFPSGKYEVDGVVQNYYTERNGYRMPDYNRLDLGVTWQRKKTAKFESSWNFSLYNAYGRENAYTITFQQNPNDPTETQALQTSLFRWVPSATYNFKF